MGQVFDKLQGKDWRRKQVGKITDMVFDRVGNQSETVNLTFEDLYIAVLLVYNGIHKRLPGPHSDPPSKEEVRSMIRATEGDSGVGKVVQKLPNSIYASLVTLAVVLFQKSVQDSD
ncbi:hypothetical protein UlMin_004900 [Ulmus minor]